MKNLIANWVCNSVCDLTIEHLQQNNIKLILSDLDNTLAGYKEDKPPKDIENWLLSLFQNNIKFVLISNNRSPERVKRFYGNLNLGKEFLFIPQAKKPKPDALNFAIKKAGVLPEETLMVGDQIFIDICAGNRAKTKTAVVRPLRNNILFALRRFVETPFIIIAKATS